MKKYLLVILVIACNYGLYAQSNKSVKGPVIKDFGQVYKIKNPDLLLTKNKKYKVIFDIYTDEKGHKKVNPNINTVARFLNMHAQNNINSKDLEIVVVLHGEATKNALSNEAFKKKFKVNNPNSELITELTKENVNFYVCGQSFAHKEYKNSDLSKKVELSLSALTALVYYQSEGYQLITFN